MRGARPGRRRRPAGARRGAGQIRRDRWGVPQVVAQRDRDLFFAFGYAMAEDRLFQLDWLRRKASGTLSEVLGADGLELDTVARTIGFRHLAEAEWAATPAETRELLEAFSAGVTAVVESSRGRWPIEFDLLDYAPAPWSPLDSLAILGEFRYYLTVRFPVIAIPELARRALGDGPLYDAFLQGEADDESILPSGSYPAAARGVEPVGHVVGWPVDGPGSNNWVVAGSRAASGRPMVASDPHIAFGAVSAGTRWPSAAGASTSPGSPTRASRPSMFGRTPRVAWGITNNICSQRDLYQERTDPAHPGCFLHDGRWEPARERGRGDPGPRRGAGPPGRPLLAERTDRGRPAARGRPPHGAGVPPLGRRGTVRLAPRLPPARPRPLRRGAARGDPRLARPDLEPRVRRRRRPHRLPGGGGHPDPLDAGARLPAGLGPAPPVGLGVIPFEAMPRLADPPRGWITTANNRPAPDDFPYPLSGTWSSGHRARRVRQMLEATPVATRDDFARMHQDALSLRAVDCLPRLLKALAGLPAPSTRVAEAARHLEAWDGRMEVDRVGATIFEAFFPRFCRAIADARFPSDQAELVAGAIAGLATELLGGDSIGWFADRSRDAALRTRWRRRSMT